MNIQEAIEKYKGANEPLSDKEVIELCKFYERVAQDLKFLGERFHHAWRAVYDDEQTLKQFKQHRGI